MGAAVLESPMETHTVWNHVPPSSVGPSAEPQVESDEKDGTRPERKQERHRQEETERPEDKRTGREEREQAEETERLEKERSDEREKQQREQKESDRLEKEKEKMETKREEREREARERLKKDREEQEQEGGGERHHQEQTCQEDRHREAAQNPQRDAAHEVMLDIGAEHDTEAPVGRTESDCRKGAENAGWHAEEDSSRAAKRVHREESPAGDRTVASGSNMEEEQFQRKRHAPGEDPREDLEESRKEERCREKEVLLEVDRLGPRDAAEDSKPWPVRCSICCLAPSSNCPISEHHIHKYVTFMFQSLSPPCLILFCPSLCPVSSFFFSNFVPCARKLLPAHHQSLPLLTLFRLSMKPFVCKGRGNQHLTCHSLPFGVDISS